MASAQPKLTTCRTCGIPLKKNKVSNHAAVCPGKTKKKPASAPQPSKKVKVKRAPTGPNRSQFQPYTGTALLGHVGGNPDEFSVPLVVSTNPVHLVAQTRDVHLTKILQQYSRFKVQAFKLSARPVVGASAAAGTTLTLGLWDNVQTPTGPPDPNTARRVKSSASISIGSSGSCSGPSRNDRWYNVIPTTDTPDSIPYMMFGSLFGVTSAVYQKGNWNGHVWEVQVDYSYIFDGPTDNPTTDLSHLKLEGLRVKLVEQVGKPAQLVVKDAALAAAVRHHALSKHDSFLRRCIGILTDLAAAGSAFLPPPWNIIVGGGAILVKSVIGEGNDADEVTFQMYTSVDNARSDDPIDSQATRTTEMQTGQSGSYLQLTDVNITRTTSSGGGACPSPSIIPTCKSMFETFGKPGTGKTLVLTSKFKDEKIYWAGYKTGPTRFRIRVTFTAGSGMSGSGSFEVTELTLQGYGTAKPSSDQNRLLEEVDDRGTVVARFTLLTLVQAINSGAHRNCSTEDTDSKTDRHAYIYSQAGTPAKASSGYWRDSHGVNMAFLMVAGARDKQPKAWTLYAMGAFPDPLTKTEVPFYSSVFRDLKPKNDEEDCSCECNSDDESECSDEEDEVDCGAPCSETDGRLTLKAKCPLVGSLSLTVDNDVPFFRTHEVNRPSTPTSDEREHLRRSGLDL